MRPFISSCPTIAEWLEVAPHTKQCKALNYIAQPAQQKLEPRVDRYK